MKDVTADTFEQEVTNSEVPVVVDFWADWCGPCKAVAPLLDEMAKEFEGLVKFTKVNIQDETVLAKEWQIRTIPTLAVVKDGQMVDRVIGGNLDALRTIIANLT